MNIDIIANPTSGKGNGRKALDVVTKYLDEQGATYIVHETTGVGHGKELAKQAGELGYDTVIALGGDGTFHEVLNGIDFSVSRLGLIPAGRGNDFVLGTNVTSSDPLTAISDILKNEPHDLDYIAISDKRCINVAGTGLDVEVLLRTAKSANKLTYVASLAKCLLEYKPYHIVAEVNGEVVEKDCIMIGVCNGTQIGGGMKISPYSDPGDGVLDVVIIEKPKKKPLLSVMPVFIKGKHIDKSYTTCFKCDSVKITTPAPVQLDGEIYYDLDFDAHIVTGGLKTFTSSASKK